MTFTCHSRSPVWSDRKMTKNQVIYFIYIINTFPKGNSRGIKTVPSIHVYYIFQYVLYYLVNTYNMQYFTSINGHRIKSKYINGFKWPSTDMQPISWVCKPTLHLHIYIKFYYNWWDTWLHFTYSNIFLQTKWRGDNMMFMCNRSLQWRPSSSVQFLYTVHVSVWLRSRRGINTAAFSVSVSVFALEPNHCRNLLTKKNPKESQRIATGAMMSERQKSELTCICGLSKWNTAAQGACFLKVGFHWMKRQTRRERGRERESLNLLQL